MPGPLRAWSVRVAAAVILSGCSLHEPRQVEAEYVLSTVDGEVLPAVIAENELAVVRVIADTIRLYGNGTGVRARVTETTSDVTLDVVEPRPRSPESFVYRITGDRFEADFPCPPEASCVAPPHLVGTLSDAGQVLTSAAAWRVLVYLRVSP